MHQSMPAAPSLPRAIAGRFARIVSPGGGTLAKLRCLGVGHLPTPGPPLTFDTHVASYPNITKQWIFLEKKKADWLISQGREKIVEGSKDMFSILCMHFFIAYQSGIT